MLPCTTKLSHFYLHFYATNENAFHFSTEYFLVLLAVISIFNFIASSICGCDACFVFLLVFFSYFFIYFRYRLVRAPHFPCTFSYFSLWLYLFLCFREKKTKITIWTVFNVDVPDIVCQEYAVPHMQDLIPKIPGGFSGNKKYFSNTCRYWFGYVFFSITNFCPTRSYFPSFNYGFDGSNY